MRVRTGTSLDAKMARNALMKQLADLPLANLAKTRARTIAKAKPEAAAPKTAVAAKG